MGSFGLLSPFDFIQIFALISEMISHLLVLLSLTGGSANLGTLLLSLLSALFPLLLNRFIGAQSSPEVVYTAEEARAAERQEKLRNLAYNESHRPEVLLFGLGPWVLQSWTNARKAMLYDGQNSPSNQLTLSQLMNQINISDLLFALQNVSVCHWCSIDGAFVLIFLFRQLPLLLMFQSSSASLGSLALYRSSIQAVVFTFGNFLTTARMAFQGIFLMGAFCAAMNIHPELEPIEEDVITYPSLPCGMKIEARSLTFFRYSYVETCLSSVTGTCRTLIREVRMLR